ncbi:YdeI/OmpD-associated family protein [Lewinella sp. IMCC34183]|uniref:YdeI/OmpD-associated family protein n=1 Tax=Lewinella sp. IMCC34183 TaxID=2248762 RepID=UPI000E26AE2F|nr:YdeI/OmpD-associated family protein [Lewinella sp. IMCC34183]
MPELERIQIESTEELRSWLEANHATSGSVWLVRYRKHTGERHVSWSELVDELLCYGWVDSLPRKLDADRTMIRISPRNPKSNWSGINKEKVARLRGEGRMTPAGEALVEIAKANGCWTFLDDVEALIVPPDLEEALAATDSAAFYYDRFPASGKRLILFWIKSAKTEATRRKRIRETVEKAARNVKAYHPKGRDSGPAPPDDIP